MSYTAKQDGRWNVPATWKDDAIPPSGTDDAITIPGDFRVTITEGTISLGPGCILTMKSGSFLTNQATLINNGTISSLGGTIQNESNARLINKGRILNGELGGNDSTIENHGLLQNENTIDSYYHIDNYSMGTIKNTSTGTISSFLAFWNSGSIANYGIISLNPNAGFANSNGYDTGHYGTLDNWGTLNLGAGGTVTWSGDWANIASTGFFSSPPQAKFTTYAGSTITLNNSTTLVLQAGVIAIQAKGQLTINSGCTLTISADAELQNAGTITINNGSTLTISADADLQNAGTILNAGTIDVLSQPQTGAPPTLGTLTNSGVINNWAVYDLPHPPIIGVINNAGDFANTGTINNAGPLPPSGPPHYSPGIEAPPAVINNTGILQNAGEINNDGTILSTAGVFINEDGGTVKGHEPEQ